MLKTRKQICGIYDKQPEIRRFFRLINQFGDEDCVNIVDTGGHWEQSIFKIRKDGVIERCRSIRLHEYGLQSEYAYYGGTKSTDPVIKLAN